jgi:fatty-acyl-CoA synthase
VIKTGGLNVSPAEIENILATQPGVRLAYVIGIPDAVRNEIVGAVIVPEGEPSKDLPEKLTAALSKELASFKVPKHYRFVKESDLPLTKSSKVQKNRLFELFKN